MPGHPANLVQWRNGETHRVHNGCCGSGSEPAHRRVRLQLVKRPVVEHDHLVVFVVVQLGSGGVG